MSMSQSYGAANRAESERALHRALDIGHTFLDTASLHGLGHNETLLGEVFAGDSVCGDTLERAMAVKFSMTSCACHLSSQQRA